MSDNFDYDFVIVGSGFGGSVSALRLSEKGYKVLIIEKGKWFSKPEDFPTSNWNVKKYFWMPALGWKGLLNLSFFRHVAVLSGVGVGGGSLVYANTLPVPKKEFYNSGHWKGLADWEKELHPFYQTAKQMLGANQHPYMSRSDKVMQQLASETVGKDSFSKTDVAVYFGTPGETVSDPYFEGKGPDRTGCILCGGCMLGCRYNSKNTLDKNYLYIAQNLGAKIISDHEVTDVIPISPDGDKGYEIRFGSSVAWFRKNEKIRAGGVIFCGGVLGTVPLLLKLKESSLPDLSSKVGWGVRTNSESLIGVTTFRRDTDYSEGIAIGSIIQLDDSRHIEPVKYPAGSGVWRLLMAPMVSGKYWFTRIGAMIKDLVIHPLKNLRTLFVDDWSKRTMILLYMESIDSTLRMVRTLSGGMASKAESGTPPTAFNPKAQDLAKKVEMIINGKAMVMNTETILGIPTTAHILGGACMGNSPDTGVIDSENRVFNYKNMYVCDGSMISANPGVNPSLSITAITERAMSRIPAKNER